MVRPYLNKSDHEEFLNQYKEKRIRRIRIFTAIFGLALLFIGTGAYYIWYSTHTPLPETYPSHLGGESENAIAENEIHVSSSTREQVENIPQRGEIETEDLKSLNNSIDQKSPASAQDVLTSSKGKEETDDLEKARNTPPLEVKKNPAQVESSTPVIKVTQKSTTEPTEEEEVGKQEESQLMQRNPELPSASEKVLFSAEKMPKFPGGYTALKRYIKSHLQMPEEAISKQVEGTVQVQFIVNTTGAISNARISKGLGNGCDEAALNLVHNMPNWIPGKHADETVAVYYNLPIDFSVK